MLHIVCDGSKKADLLEMLINHAPASEYVDRKLCDLYARAKRYGVYSKRRSTPRASQQPRKQPGSVRDESLPVL